jgi:dTDP-4-dehydrorhamnose reductase
MASTALLLTGTTGFIGARLLHGLSGNWNVVGTSRRAADSGLLALELADADSIARAFERVRPSVIVHAGGIADPDACERDPELAKRINVEAVEVLADLCGKAGARLVHFSTDYVFDGEKSQYREDDAARPISVYGHTKLSSESAALSICPSSVVLRVSNCYGRRIGAKRTYLDHWHDSLRLGRPVQAFTDQWRTPTAGDQLPGIVARLISNPDLTGIYHWGGADRATRYEAALAYCRAMGFDERLVVPALAAEREFAARRPRDTSLDSSLLASSLGIASIGLQEGFRALRTPSD